MVISLAALIVCFALCMWITLSFEEGKADYTFYFFDAILLAAIVWFGANIYNSFKKGKEEK